MSIFQEYFDYTAHLPKELNKNLKQLKELEINYNNEKNKLEISQKNSLKNNSRREIDKCIEISDAKMELANQSYFLVDGSIKKLSGIIENLEQELINTKFNDFSYQNTLLDKNFDELLNFESYLNNKKKSKSKKNRTAMKNLNLNLNVSIDSLKKRKTKKIVKINKLKGKRTKKYSKSIKKEKLDEDNLNGSIGAQFEDITYKEIDGSLGIREPIYCFCNYVSYGNMVKCDNIRCPREWFHYNCVGLTHFPKGKWFCSKKCAEQSKK